MVTTEELVARHADLRRRLAALGSMLGPGGEAGWDDCTECDMPRFRAGLKDFIAELRRHEAAETRAVGRVAQAAHLERKKAYARSHETLDHLAALLDAEASIDRGRHAYAVRHLLVRVRSELEAHLDYEERDIFPLLRREEAGRE